MKDIFLQWTYWLWASGLFILFSSQLLRLVSCQWRCPKYFTDKFLFCPSRPQQSETHFTYIKERHRLHQCEFHQGMSGRFLAHYNLKCVIIHWWLVAVCMCLQGVSGSRTYIATQGPLAHTVVDFLRMIWEYGIKVQAQAQQSTQSIL